jgi:hypothetical protein
MQFHAIARIARRHENGVPSSQRVIERSTRQTTEKGRQNGGAHHNFLL